MTFSWRNRLHAARRLPAALAAVVVALLLGVVVASSARAAVARGYVDPFTSTNWAPSRTDMGVDWIPGRRSAVVAIGDAVILGSDSRAGWPGGHMIWYQLLNGSHSGDVVYVAEHLTRMVAAGKIVRAGQQIATALPGYPWTEWGWATADGQPRSASCYKAGVSTNSGREMSRFLTSLGAPVGDAPGRGSDRPSGRLC